MTECVQDAVGQVSAGRAAVRQVCAHLPVRSNVPAFGLPVLQSDSRPMSHSALENPEVGGQSYGGDSQCLLVRYIRVAGLTGILLWGLDAPWTTASLPMPPPRGGSGDTEGCQGHQSPSRQSSANLLTPSPSSGGTSCLMVPPLCRGTLASFWPQARALGSPFVSSRLA